MKRDEKWWKGMKSDEKWWKVIKMNKKDKKWWKVMKSDQVFDQIGFKDCTFKTETITALYTKLKISNYIEGFHD